MGILRTLLALTLVSAPLAAVPAPSARAQEVAGEDAPFAGRPISRVDILGLNRVSRQTVLNTIRTTAGSPYDPRTVRLDVDLLYRLGEFRTVEARYALQEDDTIVVTFALGEQPILAGVDVTGNRVVSDQEILAGIPIREFAPRDDYLIEESKTRIRNLYRSRGHYLAEVFVDEQQLEESDILIFTVIEGPRVKVKAVEYEGNEAFSDDRLDAQTKTETAIFIFRPGRLDQKVIIEDVAAIDSFYKDRGYLDVRVDRRIELSPDSREAKVVFVINEGRVHTLREVTTLGGTIAPEQLAAWLEIKPGDVYSQDKIRKSIEAVKNSYGLMGYADAQVGAVELRTSEAPEVDLRLQIDEGEMSRIGEVRIVGNFLTKDKVVRRDLLGIQPGRPINTVAIANAERKLRATRLFSLVEIVPQPEDPENPGFRDVVVEVGERNTGSVNFGVAVGSDQGVFGDISLNQRNFDLADWPESLEEWIKGRAFRGAGQQFSLRLAPGSEISQYSISLTEPRFLESHYSVGGSAFYRERQFNEYDEERINGSLSLSRQLGEFWSVGMSSRVERVHLTAIAPFAPTEVFDAEGPDLITSVGLRLRRSTVDTFVRPGRGSVLEISVDRAGALGGEYDFTAAGIEYTVFFTVHEDFLGRKSILKFTTRASHIFESGEAPVYEQFYLGGRTFRGFEFRTISPKGIRNDNGEPSDESVGGEWLFFVGSQYEFPIFQELFNGVVFFDSGTVSDDVGFDDYRLSVGIGIRLYIDAFGPLPLAFDLAMPLMSEDTDEEEVFSFSAEIPF